ncbi:MAG TPA: phospho-sugar mutase [Polyangiaceae bacterium]|nr:phospho-sugar mutase [Polyangiaceae bacterium]
MTRADELRANAEAWLHGDPDEGTRAELASILARGDQAELAERVGAKLEFGTAGLRGLIGAGPNRMNRAVVIRTTFGLARYLAAEVPGAARRGVVIGRDGRRFSREFGEDAAGVFAAAGITVHWFEELASTPLTAFAVAHLGAALGVMITASHNPADYNGYKVYWQNGAQIVPPQDSGIAACIEAAPAASSIPRRALETARADGRLTSISGDVERAYLAGVVARMSVPADPSLRIVYTPLHGVGFPFAERAMAAAGFHPLIAVAEQVRPDATFPTTPFPNPEEPGVLDLALALARRENADLVVANDPDADRLAVAVPDDRGDFVQLTGNQVGALLGHFLLSRSKMPGEPPRAVVSTIVSSPMLGDIARSFGVHYEETLTGFKWIASRALELEHAGRRFVFGYEEALGYCVGSLVRDKDGVGAAVAFAELASACRARGETVFDYLCRLYGEFGLYASSQHNVTMQGAEGSARLARIMTALRASAVQVISGRAVVARRDYDLGRAWLRDGREEALMLPRSNVLVFELEGETRVVVRPSGTEPKLKYYLDHREPVVVATAVGDPSVEGLDLGTATALAAAEVRARAELRAVSEGVDGLLLGR